MPARARVLIILLGLVAGVCGPGAAEARGHGAMYQAPAGGPARTGGLGVASSGVR